jgi:hypothetical protein
MGRNVWGGVIAIASCLGVVLGCSNSAIKTHPVNGKIEVKGGDVALLTGSSIELKSSTDENLRPMGNIDASGNFSVKTIYQGEVVQGAPEGQYQARIILADPTDDGVPKRKGDPIHRRFLDFSGSGIKFTVPSSDYDVSLSK